MNSAVGKNNGYVAKANRIDNGDRLCPQFERNGLSKCCEKNISVSSNFIKFSNKSNIFY